MKVVYIHGLGGDADTPLARLLKERYDFEAVEYYELSRKPGWIAEALHRVYRGIPDEPHILVGESLGGLFAVYSVKPSTQGLVLVVPALSLNMGLRLFLITEVMKRGYVTLSSKHPVRMNKEDVDRLFQLMKQVPVPRRLPVLIVAAEEDNLIDNGGLHKFFSSLNTEKAWYVEVSGADHAFAERENEVVALMDLFLGLHVEEWKPYKQRGDG